MGGFEPPRGERYDAYPCHYGLSGSCNPKVGGGIRGERVGRLTPASDGTDAWRRRLSWWRDAHMLAGYSPAPVSSTAAVLKLPNLQLYDL